MATDRKVNVAGTSISEKLGELSERIRSMSVAFWTRLSARERALLIGSALTAVLVAPVLAADHAAMADDRVATAHMALAERRALHPATGSSRVLDEVKLEIESWSYVSDTVALARIGIQNQVLTTAQAAGMTDVRLTVDQEPQVELGIPLLRVEMSANFSWDSLTLFFDGLGFAPNGYLVDSVRRTGPQGGRLELVLLAPIRSFEFDRQ